MSDGADGRGDPGGGVDEGARRAFEAAWRTGRPRIEDFLPAAGSASYGATLEELVAIDLELAAAAGETPDLEGLTARFPLLAEPVRAARLEEAAEAAREVAAGRLQAGRVLGHYVLVGEHGRGGFGAVWRAHDPRLGRDVAVKVLHRSEDPAARARFLGEARLAAGLEHPGIVPVHDVGDPKDRVPYFAMKLLQGRTLAAVVAELHKAPIVDRVLERRALDVVLAVARAVDFAHSRGEIHRDLKPANVLVGDYGETVVLDWGIGKRVGDEDASPAIDAGGGGVDGGHELTREGALLGTPAYMAPEQARGEGAREGADVFALGATLFEVLTGRPARVGSSGTAVITAAAGPPARAPSARSVRPSVPRALDALCGKAMAADPAQRYANAGDFARDLERYLADEPVSALPDTALARLGRSMRRHRTAWAAGGVAASLLTALAVVAGFLWQRGERLQALSEAQRVGELTQRAAQVEAVALADAGSGRYAAATDQLGAVLPALDGEPSLGGLAARLSALRGRLERLERLERLGDLAQFLSGEERYVASLEAADAALEAVGANGERWWEALPVADLPVERRRIVTAAVHRLILLSASVRISRALAVATPEELAARCPPAVAAVRRAASFEPSVYGRLIHAVCDAMGFGGGSAPPLPAGPTAADAFFLGLLHLWLDQFPDSAVADLLPVLTAAAPGLDLDEPMEAATRLLADAVRLDPRSYWPPFLLGWALSAQDDRRGAELAFDLALSLRPDYPRALEGRGRAILEDALEQGDQVRIVVGLADFDRALALAPDDPWTHWARANALDTLDRAAEAATSRRRALLLDPAALSRVLLRRRTEELSALQGPDRALEVAEAQLAREPGDHAQHALAAAARLCRGEDAAAVVHLAGAGDDVFSDLLRGIVAVRGARYEAALGPLEAATRSSETAFLGHQGRALALQALGRTADAGQAARKARSAASLEWQVAAAAGLGSGDSGPGSGLSAQPR